MASSGIGNIRTGIPVVYYPSCVALLAVRLDEAYQPEQDSMPDAISVDTLVQRPNSGSVGLAKMPSTLPDMLSGKFDALTLATERIPKGMTVELPGYRQAGKFSLTLDFQDLALDPRQIRAIGVEIHLGTVSGTAFAQGMSTTVPGIGGRPSVIKTRDSGGNVNLDTLVIMGSADEISWHHTKDSSEITLEGRDLRGILLDSPIRPDQLRKLKLSASIVDVIAQIISFHPFGERFRVKYVANEWPNNTPTSPGVVGDYTRVRLGAQEVNPGNPSGSQVSLSGAGDPRKCNFWDMITKYCFLCGAVPYFVGPNLWIRKARTLFDTVGQDIPTVIRPTDTSAFLSQGLPATRAFNGERLKTRRMVYGENILDLKMVRKLGGVTTPTIELVCVNTSSDQRGMNPVSGLPNRLLVSQFDGINLTHPVTNPPPILPHGKRRNVKRTKMSPNGKTALQEFLRIPVHGIANIQLLDELAIDVFNEVARQELTGSFSTKDLASLAGDNEDADLLRLRPGDPMELMVRSDASISSSPVEAELIRNERFHESRLAQAFSDETNAGTAAAKAVARTKRGSSVPELQRFFRTANVKFAWSTDDGVTVSADFQNYVQIRLQDDAAATNGGTSVVGQSIAGGIAS